MRRKREKLLKYQRIKANAPKIKKYTPTTCWMERHTALSIVKKEDGNSSKSILDFFYEEEIKKKQIRYMNQCLMEMYHKEEDEKEEITINNTQVVEVAKDVISNNTSDCEKAFINKKKKPPLFYTFSVADVATNEKRENSYPLWLERSRNFF